MKVWLLFTGSFLAGIVVGALTYGAADHHVRVSLEAPKHYSAAEVTRHSTLKGVFLSDKGDAAEMTMPAASKQADRWETVDEVLLTLDQRLTALEAQQAETASVSPVEADVDSAISAASGMNQETLVAAGVDPGLATDLLRRQSQLEMQRLELRDQASREGWIDSERFVEELRELEGNVGDLREEIGDDAYDRFLYLTGQPNRVMIASVIDESPAQQAGVKANNVVLGYADSRIFSYPELLDATRAGVRGEYIVMRVQRMGETLELTLPRGPMGVRLEPDQIDPDAGR